MTEAARASARPCVSEGAEVPRRRASELSTRAHGGIPLPSLAAASQTRRRVHTFHPAPSARRRVGRPLRSRTAGLPVPFPSTSGPPFFYWDVPSGVIFLLPFLTTQLVMLAW